jgi:DnaJ-class molecular chaperone
VTKDLYAVLGLQESASADEIKKAFRNLAKKYHPDKTAGDKSKETRFKEISAAYDVLSDPQKRQKYDAMRRSPYGDTASEIELEDLFSGAAGGGFGGFGDLFGQVFREAARGGGNARVVFESGGRAPRWAQAPEPEIAEEIRTRDGHILLRQGNDILVDVPITIEEAVNGGKVEVPTLGGRVTVTIPPGSSSGRKLRLKGKGVGGRGDQYVTLQIVVPERVDDRARELIREFSRRAPVKPRR